MKRRVLFVITGLGLGGAENQLVKIALGLRKRNWEVSIYTFLRPTHFQVELESEGIKVFSTNLVKEKSHPLLQFLKIERDLRKVIKELEPDVLVCFMFHAYFVGRIVGRKTHLPVISSIRTEKNIGLKRTLTRLTDRMSAATVFNSRVVAEKAINESIVKRTKARVIPNGIQIERFQYLDHFENRKKMSQELSVDLSSFIWIAVGRLEKPKNYPNLLNAFKIVLDHQEDTVLVIAGEGSERSTVESIIDHLGISKKVFLIGQRHDVPELLSGSDAFVLSSSWEGSPNALIEALASGLPAVSTNVGGVKELMGLLPDFNGIVSPDDSIDLADKMLVLMARYSTSRDQLRANASEAVLCSYNFELIVDQYENLLLEALTGSGEVLQFENRRSQR